MSRRLSQALWVLMTLSCVLFAVMAAEFYVVTVTHSVPTYARLLAVTVSEDFAYGPESGFAQLTPYWRSMPAFNQVILGGHALLASIALAVGPFQFVPAFRNKWPKLHKLGGRLYVFTALPAMALSFVYLAITPMFRIYGGAPFYVGLMGIAFMATYTLLAAWGHIMRGEVVAHRVIMVLNFAVMLIAPLLRFWWMFLGWLYVDIALDQATTHVAVLMFLALQVMVGAIVVVHLQAASLQGPRSAPIVRAGNWAKSRLIPSLPILQIAGLSAGMAMAYGVLITLGAPDPLAAFRDPFLAGRDLTVYQTHAGFLWLRTLGLLGVFISFPVLVRRQFEQGTTGGHATGFFGGSLVLAVVGWLGSAHGYGAVGVGGLGASTYWSALAVAVLTLGSFWLHAVWNRRLRASRELTLHLYMLAWAPVTQGLLQWGFLWLGFTWEDAFLSAAVMAPPVNLSVSYYYTVYGARSAANVGLAADLVDRPGRFDLGGRQAFG